MEKFRMIKQVIKNKLVLKEYTNQFTEEIHRYNLKDILAIIPQNEKICIVTKHGEKDFIRSFFPCEDCSCIHFACFNDIFKPISKPLFIMLTNHSIINTDEIKDVKISKKDNIIITFENFKLSVNEKVDWNKMIIDEVMTEKNENTANND